MWTAIKYVSSGLTLVAFLFALAAWLYRSHLKLLKKEDLIKSVPEEKRADLVERTLVLFKVDTSKLTRDQQYDLALKQIREQARKFQVTAVVIVVIAIIAAILTLIAISKVSPSPTPTPTPGSLSGEIDRAEVVTGPGGNAQLFIHLSIKNDGSATPVNKFNLNITHVRSKSINYNGPFEEINGRYTVLQSGGKPPIVIQPQDSIIRKTQESIGKDRKADGWLMLGLPLPEGVLRQAGIRYAVSFADANGKNYEVTYEVQ